MCSSDLPWPMLLIGLAVTGAGTALGASFEGQIAFPAVLARWPRIEIAAARLDWIDSMVLRGMKSMPLRVRH